MQEPPKFDDAPGVVVKPRKRGFAVTWQCRTDIALKGFVPKSVRLLLVKAEPLEMERNFISDQCQRLQNLMLAFSNQIVPIEDYDGTVGSLIRCYETDPDSPYQKLRYYSKKNYGQFLKRIRLDHGSERIADIKARQVLRWYEDWCKRGVPMAHGLMTMMRTIVAFGSTILDKQDCRDAKAFLSDMKFAMSKPRKSILTADNAVAIRALAHQRGLRSIALAQAIQFEVMLRQRDVIGEWVPQSEKGDSDVTDDGMKWLRGIRWEEIDKDLILRHVTSKRQKEIEVNLRLCPMVMEELDRIDIRPSRGPIIVCEETGKPWSANMFRRKWRDLATACGIPKDVRNMDSRAGAISEATSAGADIEHVRQAATHSDISTTQGYSRDAATKTAAVQMKRVEYRNKTRTGND